MVQETVSFFLESENKNNNKGKKAGVGEEEEKKIEDFRMPDCISLSPEHIKNNNREVSTMSEISLVPLMRYQSILVALFLQFLPVHVSIGQTPMAGH